MITMRVFKCTLPAHSGILAPSTALRFASTAMKDDREVVLVACNKNGLALGYAPAALQADREVVVAACNQNGLALRYASDALQAHREVVVAACNQDGMALMFASAALNDDREVVLAACTQYGRALQFASAAMKDRREVVLAACNQDGFALRFASAALRDNREVVMVAIATNYQWTVENPEAFDVFTVHHASPALQAEFAGDRSVTHVRNRLRQRSSFFGPFLCGIAFPRPEAAAAAPGKRCLLPRLDIGEEKPIQQLIAAFTGVPIGSSWRLVQLAAAHLAPHL